jgi:LysM repeat protein
MPTAEAVTTPTVPSTPTPTTRHSVAPGEVLSTIAARYGVTVEAIVAANGLEDPNQLEVGQVLVIPELAP